MQMGKEVNKISLRITEPKNVLELPKEILIIRKNIINKLKDAVNLDNVKVKDLVKAYVTKIYAHQDKITITGGVNMIGCGGSQHSLPTILFGYFSKI